MKTEKLYDLLGLKPYTEPVRPRYELIISNEAAALFKNIIYVDKDSTEEV